MKKKWSDFKRVKQGKPTLIQNEFDSKDWTWDETDYLLSTPANAAHLMESIAQHKASYPWPLLSEQEFIEGSERFKQHLHDERIALDELTKQVHSIGKTFEDLSAQELAADPAIVKARLLSEGKEGPASNLF